MSRLKCVGVLIAVAGAICVELYSAKKSMSEEGGDLGGRAGGSAGPAWLGSLILFWQVCDDFRARREKS